MAGYSEEAAGLAAFGEEACGGEGVFIEGGAAGDEDGVEEGFNGMV